MRRKLRIPSIELSLKTLILLNSKELMKMSLSGPDESHRLKPNNTKISTKMCFQSQAILSHILTLLLKDKPSSLVLSLSLKEHLMTNSRNSMKRSQRLNCM